MTTADANARLSTALVTALAAGGVEDVIVSPGSRSTPLVLAFEGHPAIRTHVVLDERVAAFVGLGLARVKGQPVALLCTSGSAGAHYLPALVEARASCVPLIAITADRPPELHGCGAPQAMDQAHLFGRHVLEFAQLGPPDGVDRRGWVRHLCARLLAVAGGPPAGPVHVNVSFRKPLWSPANAAVPALAESVPRRVDPTGFPALPGEWIRRLEATERGLIVCGPRALACRPADADAACEALTALARHLSWPIVAEPLAQLRFGPHDRSQVIASADALLREGTFSASHRPDVVLRFGQIPTSGALQSWLADSDAPTLLVDPAGHWHDPAHGASLLVACDPVSVAVGLRVATEPSRRSRSWLDAWCAADAVAQRALELSTEDDVAWEGAVVRRLVRALPDGALLHVASSMAVRDHDAFAGSGARRVRVAANRGLNGIDGTIATSLGEALGWEGPVVLLIGDLAFLHDIGGLAAARGLGARVSIVVLDNGGGGIFGQLPIASHPTAFEKAFLTPQEASLVPLARACGVPAREVSVAGLERALADSMDGLGVFVVPFAREASEARREAAYGAVSHALRDAQVLA